MDNKSNMQVFKLITINFYLNMNYIRKGLTLKNDSLKEKCVSGFDRRMKAIIGSV